MAGIYDVHTHLNDELYEKNELQAFDLIKQAKKMGIDLINIVGVNLESSKVAVRQATQARHVYALVGIHPNEVAFAKQNDLKNLEKTANSKMVVGIGEIGLNYALENKSRTQQLEFFENQIRLAEGLNLPIMVHLEDKPDKFEAFDDAYKVLNKFKTKNVIIHGFDGDLKYAEKFLDQGYFISLNGKITYGSKALEKVVKKIPLNKILIESDCPYYSPIPYEKEMNYPWNTNLVAEKIAQIKKIDIDEVILASRVNGQKIFKLDNKKKNS